MSEIEQAERNIKVENIGSQTEEGRLKLEQIVSFKNSSYHKKIGAIFSLSATLINTILIILSSNLITKENIRTPINTILIILEVLHLIRVAGFTIESKKDEKRIRDLEEEILNMEKEKTHE